MKVLIINFIKVKDIIFLFQVPQVDIKKLPNDLVRKLLKRHQKMYKESVFGQDQSIEEGKYQ